MSTRSAAGRRHEEVWSQAEQVARVSYGRLLAILAARTDDLELAEDALGDAFARALQSWPAEGVPENPEGWLLTVARNRQRDALKSSARRMTVALEPSAAPDQANSAAAVLEEIDPTAIPDRRLALLFVCGHPAIDPSIRTPLMLQTILGFDAKQIGRAFAVPPLTMAQRLVRAKRRIRKARIPFAIPDRGVLPARVDSVLEAIYGAYAIDFGLVAGPTARETLAAEAHFLAVTLAELLPDDPEVLGLAALISLSLARTAAGGAPAEAFVPLEEQDPASWDRALIADGERYLRRAHGFGRIGRFQLEAAIQSVHCARATTGATDWAALHRLYGALLTVAPTLGAQVAFAAATGRIHGPLAGMDALDGINDPAVQRFQPAWATRAHLLAESGQIEAASAAFDRAISLTADGAMRRYLERKRSALERSTR